MKNYNLSFNKIRTKIFSGYDKEVYDGINQFFIENPNFNLIDIVYDINDRNCTNHVFVIYSIDSL